MLITKVILLAVATLMAGSVWAKLPPPPVNQNLGVPDGTFSDMTFHTCLVCHGDPENAPAPVKIGYLPDRHHLRVDTPIDTEFTASKFPEKSPDGTHKCITCHLIDWVEDASRPLGGYFEFAEEPSSPQFRDCLTCHVQKKKNGILIATVHHLTDKAQRKLCHQCHGSLINDPTVEHRVADPRRCGEFSTGGDRSTYDITKTTPWPGDNYNNESWVPMLKSIFSDCPDFGKRFYDPDDPNELGGDFIDPPRYRYEVDGNGEINAIFVPDNEPGGRRTGNCEHCHFSGSNPGDAVQSGTGLAKSDIGTNMINHHSTGVGQPGSGSVHNCSLCHAPNAPPNYTFRGCEVCHGFSSLHAIEYDAEGDGINISTEKPFMGHVGNSINCRGCHMNYRIRSTSRVQARSFGNSALFGETAPNISEISTVGAIEGVATELSIVGNSLEGPSTRIELTATDGTVTEIDMIENDHTTARTIIPDNIVADNYELSVVRGRDDLAVRSPSISFLVTRNTHINSASCDDSGMVTLTGAGFGVTYIEGTDDLGLYDETNNFCAVESWSDIKIIANCSAGISNITVKGLFGEASSDINCDDTGSGRPDWWGVWSWWSSWGWGGR